MTVPASDTLREPQGNLTLSILDGVRSVADVSSDIDGEITADGTRSGVRRLGSTKHDTSSFDGVLALPNHAANRAGQHVLDQTSEKSLGRQISVVSLEQLALRLVELQSLELESL